MYEYSLTEIESRQGLIGNKFIGLYFGLFPLIWQLFPIFRTAGLVIEVRGAWNALE